eukprot:SM000077S21628  [mRNA]  locus=s77:500995:502834:- [translate_table: standard]
MACAPIVLRRTHKAAARAAARRAHGEAADGQQATCRVVCRKKEWSRPSPADAVPRRRQGAAVAQQAPSTSPPQGRHGQCRSEKRRQNVPAAAAAAAAAAAESEGVGVLEGQVAGAELRQDVAARRQELGGCASGGSACAAAAKNAGRWCGTSAVDFCKPGFESSVEVSGFSSMAVATVLTLAAALAAGSDGGGGGAAARGTTVLCVRKGGAVVVIADGQVTQGAEIIKPTVRKVRRISEGVIGGFAGATADAFTLFERLESRIEEHPGTALATVFAATLKAIS